MWSVLGGMWLVLGASLWSVLGASMWSVLGVASALY